MKYLVLVISLMLSLLLDLTLRSAGSLRFTVPLFSVVIFFWFWRFALPKRLLLGGLAGAVLDSISLFPFGTYIVIFLSIGIFVEVLQRFFSNVSSPLTQWIGVALMTLLFLVLTPIFAKILMIVS